MLMYCMNTCNVKVFILLDLVSYYVLQLYSGITQMLFCSESVICMCKYASFNLQMRKNFLENSKCHLSAF